MAVREESTSLAWPLSLELKKSQKHKNTKIKPTRILFFYGGHFSPDILPRTKNRNETRLKKNIKGLPENKT